ncbi:MAG: O-antigen ligase family protein [Nitrospirota bacterium]
MDKIIYGLFVFILIFSPIAFGTVEQWSLTVMETSSLLALTLLLLKNVRDKTEFFRTPGIIPLFLILSYMSLQLVPLPPGVIKFISPKTYSLYDKTVWVEGQSTWTSLSISRKSTLTEFFRFATYAAFYVLTVQIMARKNTFKKTVAVVIGFASILSFLGIMQHILSNNKIFWFRALTHGGTPFGPYVNRNHYAGLMGMIFPLVLTVFLYHKPAFSYGSLRERIYEIFSQKKTNAHILLGFSAVLIALSIFLSISRGGIISLTLSMIFLGVMLMRKGEKSRRGTLIILTFVLILYSVGWFGWDPIFERFEKIRNPGGDISELRLDIWKDSLNIIKDFPVTGTGFGSFVNIYPKYRTIHAEGTADHVHNDYIELLTDGGIVAALLFLWFIASVLFKSYNVFLKRKELYSRYIFIGSLAGIISILFHSITDFNLHIAANGLYFFFLAGLAVSSANTRLYEERRTYLHKLQSPLSKKTLVFSSAFFLLCCAFNISVLAGQFYFSSSKAKISAAEGRNGNLDAIRKEMGRASFLDPLEASYHYEIANTERVLSNNDTALNQYKKAVQLNPLSAQYLQMSGLVMSEMKRDDAADRLLRAGIEFDAINASRYRVYALWLLSHGKKEKGIIKIREAIFLEPKRTGEYITTMVLNGLSDIDIVKAIPEKSEAGVIFADYLLRTGQEEMAEKTYLDALGYAEDENDSSPSIFSRVYEYFRAKGEYDNALSVIRRASRKFPDDISTRLLAARAYEEAGIFYRAIAEYKKVLILDPGNSKAREKLDVIK